MYSRTPVKATIPSDTQNPGNGLSRPAALRRSPCAPPRTAKSPSLAVRRAADGCPVGPPRRRQLWTHRRTVKCRWPQRFVAARTLSSHICSARASMTTATLSSGSSRERTAISAPGTAPGRRRRAGARLPARSSPLSTVRRMRPERDEIIICTGVNCSNLGVQYWGDHATGLFVNGKYR